MDNTTAEFWGGVVMLAVGAVLLFAPVALAVEYTLAVLLVGTLGLVGGSPLIALSRRV
ncbi:hypothetical protein [Halosimplex sp. TS25]|uniref:hypothetical protein n=1 Tax=Halosimplex rarum TaxID=3396619 RepID=UPI0039ED0B5F